MARLLDPLALRLDLTELEFLRRQSIVHGPRVGWLDLIQLREVLDLDDLFADPAEHSSSIIVQMLARDVRHDVLIQIAGLIILSERTSLVVEVAFARDDIITHFIRRFGGVGAEFVDEAVRCVLWVLGVVSVDPHRAVEVQGRVGRGHEGAVCGDLVQVYADAVVLGVAVEEHAELEERVGTVFDSWDHAAGGEGGLFDITMVWVGVS